jgi:hypothetical protein
LGFPIQIIDGQTTELPEKELIINHDFLHTTYDIIITPMYALKDIVLSIPAPSISEGGGSSSTPEPTEITVPLPYCYVSEVSSGSFKIKYSKHYYGKELRWRVLE